MKRTPHQRPPDKGQGLGEVVDLTSRRQYRPDLGSLARQQVASARHRLGLTFDEFAEVLGSALGWSPTPEMVESWEAEIVPPGDVVLAAGLSAQAAPRDGGPTDTDPLDQLLAGRYLDLEAVYATRSEFTSRHPPHALFDGASDILAAGLSLNIICQQYADDRLRGLVAAGGTVRCLFLDPAGEAIKAREREEGYDAGHLATLTDLNINILDQRVRQRLPDDARQRLIIATYDEVIRFNITILDGTTAIIQPYLYGARGVEAPTFVLRKHDGGAGLFPAFERTVTWLWERSNPR